MLSVVFYLIKSDMILNLNKLFLDTIWIHYDKLLLFL